VRTLARGDNDALRERWLRRLAGGEALAGVAFTHLRRPGPPAVRAERSGAGWRIHGEIAWLTSWHLADTFLVGAQTGDDVVWCLAPLREVAGVQVVPLRLMAMSGTSTVRLRLDDVSVDDDDVALVEPLAAWRAADAAKTADVNPAVFGVTREAVDRLRALAEQRDDPAAALAADAVERQLLDLRAAAYALVDEVAARERVDERVDERLRLRAEAHVLACRATQALVAAWSGRAVALDAPAQRLAREALFLLVQGQTGAVRAATLERLARG
jgi:alkylation response protein AidB-like acyl-CoA dehydrogenase